MSNHLAVFTPPFLDSILSGEKTIEARFSKVRCAPFGVVAKGDIVLMKHSGGLVKGSFEVEKVQSLEGLDESKLQQLAELYSDELCAASDHQFWQRRQLCKYATLIWVTNPIRFEQPFSFPKKDRRGWVVI